MLTWPLPAAYIKGTQPRQFLRKIHLFWKFLQNKPNYSKLVFWKTFHPNLMHKTSWYFGWITLNWCQPHLQASVGQPRLLPYVSKGLQKWNWISRKTCHRRPKAPWWYSEPAPLSSSPPPSSLEAQTSSPHPCGQFSVCGKSVCRTNSLNTEYLQFPHQANDYLYIYTTNLASSFIILLISIHSSSAPSPIWW